MSKLFSCCRKRSVKLLTLEEYNRRAAIFQTENLKKSGNELKPQTSGKRNIRNIFRDLFKRRTKEEEILLFEKRYLRKYLRYHKLYVTGMTLQEMRVAKRCLDASISAETQSGNPPGGDKPDEEPDSQCGCCCCCCCFGPREESRVDSKGRKRVSFHKNLVQWRYIPEAIAGPSHNGETVLQAMSGDSSYVHFEQPEP